MQVRQFLANEVVQLKLLLLKQACRRVIVR
jgi:hypothetical protein